MAITKIADVIVPELFNRYVINRTMELSAFFQSGIVVNSPEFDALASEAAEHTICRSSRIYRVSPRQSLRM